MKDNSTREAVPQDKPQGVSVAIPDAILEEAQELCRAAELLPAGVTQLASRIMHARAAGRNLRVKLGVDPTGSQLHLGHTVVLRKLRRFQDFQHQAVLIIGGFTARIGDPTGRNAARPSLSPEEVAANAQSFLQQAGGILDVSRLEVRNNADWLAKMDLGEMMTLAARTTVNRLIAKEGFGSRLERQQPVGLHELFYPLLQGWDSVVVNADVEIGGTDQRFNILQGRELQQLSAMEPQLALMLPILEGTDGERKMSKTFGNAICLDDTADDVFAKTMRLPDHLVVKFLELATSLGGAEVEAARQSLKQGTNPMLEKQKLARQLVLELHGQTQADEALAAWQRVHTQREAPLEMPSLVVPRPTQLVALLVQCGFATSNNRARELVRSGAVSLDANKVLDINFVVPVPPAAGTTVKSGKRNFIKLVPQD